MGVVLLGRRMRRGGGGRLGKGWGGNDEHWYIVRDAVGGGVGVGDFA